MKGRIKLDLNLSLFENVTQVEMDEYNEAMVQIKKYYDKFDFWIKSLNLTQKVIFGIAFLIFLILGISECFRSLIALLIFGVFTYLDWDNFLRIYFCTYITLKKFYSVHPVLLIAINAFCSFMLLPIAGIGASGHEIPSGELFNSIVKVQLPDSKTEFSRNNFHTIINRLKNKGFLKTRSIKTIPPVSFISLTDLGREYLKIFENNYVPKIKSEMNVVVPEREEIELSEDDKIELVERISSIIINDSLQKEYEDIDEKLARRIKNSAIKIIEKLMKELQ